MQKTVQTATDLRRRLHSHPETAFQEEQTSRALEAFLVEHGVTIVDRMAGHGLLCRVGPPGRGPLLRADMDGLPLTEATGASHASRNGAHHACGHDGHMAMLAGALAALAADPPGTVHAIFQPAEETGEGAARVLQELDIDVSACFALHNVPGLPLGAVQVRDGTAAVASCGLSLRLEGVTSHAGEPHLGRSPVAALAALVHEVEAAPRILAFQRAALATIVGLSAGGPRYGTSPGDGALHATLRAATDDDLERLLVHVEQRAKAIADAHGLSLTTQRIEPFPASINDAECVQAVRRAASAAGLPIAMAHMAPWSEDFGHVLRRWPGALFLLGSGEDQPDLHHAEYDFPDALLEPGIALWTALAREAA